MQIVVLLAGAKIGAELKAAQERGEVARRGDNQHVPHGNTLPATAAELGMTRKQAMNAKALADAGETRIRASPMTRSAISSYPASLSTNRSSTPIHCL